MTVRTIRVALVEDAPLLLSLLADRLRSESDLQVVAAVSTCASALQTLTPGSTDVALLDLGLPDGNGVSLGCTLQRADPELRVVVLSAHDMLAAVRSAHPAGCPPWSYVSKRSALASDQLATTVRSAVAGECVIDQALTEVASPRPPSPLESLSPAQRRVLRLVAQGLNNQAIAADLGVSVKAVEMQLTSVYRVLAPRPDQNPRSAAILEHLRSTEHDDPSAPPPGDH